MEMVDFKCNPLARQDVIDLVTVILRNTYFQFNGTIFSQVKGLAMGSNISPILAILFMDTIERKAMMGSSLFGFYSRYVDDVFILTRDRSSAENILSLMNGQHPSITFELEHAVDDARLSLLDMEIIVSASGELQFQFYKKPAKKEIFVRYDSALPTDVKRNIISNEKVRITDRCSTNESKNKHLEKFGRLLLVNGYPSEFMPSRLSRTTKRKHGVHKEEVFHFKSTFINDYVHQQLKGIFTKHGIPVRFYHSNRSLRNVLSNLNTPKECTLKGCIIQSERLCFKQNIVYKVTCNKCGECYIGSTVRCLHTRIMEHVQADADTSSIARHFKSCFGNDVTICNRNATIETVAVDRDPVNLRLKEAIIIRTTNPKINSKEEANEFKDLVW